MPSLKMKTKLSTGSLKEKKDLRVCQKSSIISKKSCSHGISQQKADLDACIKNCQNVSSSTEVSIEDQGSDESIDQKLLDELLQEQPLIFVDSATVGRMDSTVLCSSSKIETIFSPALEPSEDLSEPKIDSDSGSNNDSDVPRLGSDDSEEERSYCHYPTCNVSDFYVSEMLIAGVQFNDNAVEDGITQTITFPDDNFAKPNMSFDVDEQYTVLPYLEETVKTSNTSNAVSSEEMIHPDNDLYLAITQLRPPKQESGVDSHPNVDHAGCFDPNLLIKNFPELSDVVSNFRPNLLPKETRTKSITLVLDLDETLVHSTLEPCDADFTFNVFFNMQEHTVYVKQRPHLKTFLERVAEMFEVIVFTASQSIYAEQLLDILDPDGKFISRRAYRESCIFSDGGYTKDLTVLGVDLAKIAIIDNSPQVFQLQVNNGIPIKSWFDDPLDTALISLLPFLEILADADDVRPIIARKFGNKE